MHHSTGIAEVDDAFENAVKILFCFNGVIRAAAELHRAWPIIADRLPHSIENGDRFFGGLHQMAAASALADFLHRAGQIYIDHIITKLHQNLRTGSNLIRMRTHELPCDRMIRINQFRRFQTTTAIDEKLIEHRLGDSERRAMPARHQPHRSIGIARQARLKKWSIDCQLAHLYHERDYTRMTPSRWIQEMPMKALVLLCLVCAGCSQPLAEITRPRALFGTRADPTLAVDLAKFSYPQDAAAGGDLDILVIKNGDRIHFVNRTTTVHTKVQLWINQQYVGLIDEIPIGISSSHPLGDFINRYGEAFPVGGFLNPDKSFPIVLAELFNPSTENSTRQRHKLTVRSED